MAPVDAKGKAAHAPR